MMSLVPTQVASAGFVEYAPDLYARPVASMAASPAPRIGQVNEKGPSGGAVPPAARPRRPDIARAK